MQDNSDQFAISEEEAAFHEEVIGTDDPVEQAEETEEDGETVDETESEEEGEPVKPKKPGFVEIKDPAVKARVDQLSREKHENERKYKAEKLEREKIARELEELKRPGPPKEVPAPTADPITEPEVFARQQQERDKYIREHTKYESETESRKQARQAEETQKRVEMVDGYKANMERLKISPEVMRASSDICAQYGITGDHPLVDELLEDKDGPAIVRYLANNQEHLSEIANMRPAKALAYIEREIRAKLNVQKQSKAPPPPTKVNGTRTTAKGAEGWTIS